VAAFSTRIRIAQRHLLRAISGMKRQITPEMLAFYNTFRDGSDRGMNNQRCLS
jgi:hypothetical protein